MEMTRRLLQTGLNLLARGDTALASVLLDQVPTELADRNRLLEERLYPLLAEGAELARENRRLERLAQSKAWEELLPALSRQLAREAEARHNCSLRPLPSQAI